MSAASTETQDPVGSGLLLAVDLGLKTGLALYNRLGRLVWYRSRNFGTTDRLRRAIRHLFDEMDALEILVIEGGGPLAEIWMREATRRAIAVHRIGADQWRKELLYPRQQRTGPQAKRCADPLARRVIEWSGAPRPTSLRHDAAEAVLVGLWGVLHVGWLPTLPEDLRP
jgi:hypothetical protein